MLADLGWTSLAALALVVLVNTLYWAFTGLSPWPFVTLGTLVGGFIGVVLLALAMPSHR